jgi:hypothetical protein
VRNAPSVCVRGCFLAQFRAVMPSDPTPETLETPDQLLETPPLAQAPRPREIGGREGPDPTRYGDWELRGRCVDF